MRAYNGPVNGRPLGADGSAFPSVSALSNRHDGRIIATASCLVFRERCSSTRAGCARSVASNSPSRVVDWARGVPSAAIDRSKISARVIRNGTTVGVFMR